jgi:hypothetical protein
MVDTDMEVELADVVLDAAQLAVVGQVVDVGAAAVVVAAAGVVAAA